MGPLSRTTGSRPRVLAAADAFHAMTEPRSYRAALDVTQATRQLQHEAREGRLAGRGPCRADGSRATHEKVGLSSRAGLALFAIEHDLIRP
jgi:hypothetical protein